jgi:hypothetical protein
MKSILYRPSFPLVVSAYTVNSHLADYYKKASQKLSQSCIDHDIQHVIYPLRAANNWFEGCSLKPTVIAHALKTFNQPILWLDADAVVLKYPSLLETLKVSLALHVGAGGHWLSGTLFATPAALTFVEQWKQATDPTVADEITLLHLYRKTQQKPTMEALPSAYNCVVHSATDTSDTVIGHFLRPDEAKRKHLDSVPIANRY